MGSPFLTIFILYFTMANFLCFIIVNVKIAIHLPSSLSLTLLTRLKWILDNFYSSQLLLVKKKKKILNSYLSSYLRPIIGVIHLIPLTSLQVKCIYPPLQICSRRLAGKFILKIINSHCIVNNT